MFIERVFRFLPKSNLKKALGYFNKGDYKRASGEFELYISRGIDGKSKHDQAMIRMYMVESYIMYAKKLFKEDNFEESARQLEKAIELEPRFADILFSLGHLYDKLLRNDESRDYLQRALAINPNYFKARILLARIYHVDGRYQRAMEELETSLSCSPTFYIEQVKTLMEQIRMGSSYDEREGIFLKLLEEKPSSSQVCKQIALEAIQRGEHDVAIAELKKSLSMNPNYPDLHNMLGIAYANKGMMDDAIIEFEKSLKIHPDYIKARLNIALTLYEKGDCEGSSRHCTKVLDLDPNNVLAQNLLRELQPVLEED